MKNWKDCAQFHGHECGGLTIGYKASLLAIELLKLEFSDDEQVVCIAENDACGLDAIQVMLGCSIGKGNLLFHMRGKSAYSFYNRKTGESVRLVLKPTPAGMTREQSFAYYQSKAPGELFDRQTVNVVLPENGRSSETYVCAICGETGGANWFRFVDGKPLCLDCIAEQEDNK